MGRRHPTPVRGNDDVVLHRDNDVADAELDITLSRRILHATVDRAHLNHGRIRFDLLRESVANRRFEAALFAICERATRGEHKRPREQNEETASDRIRIAIAYHERTLGFVAIA